ncbi:peptidase C39 [Pseudothauera rhizosphaerae]|uniref:Peptidase C39 n=2 Tax=Pseudothauera rhizosphaerae TaxID=2565932 RepID=A0A4S4AY50_9RHOO|nr:peptidase C39 [Pseudothauera rhizosphaerae]
MRRIGAALASLAALGLAGGAALAETVKADVPRLISPTGATYAVPVTTMKGARYVHTMHQQYDFSCGSAAVATLLTHHYGFKASEEQVFQHMFERGDQAKIRQEGFSMLDMKQYLDAMGFPSAGVEARLDQLVQANVPAIALINENGYSHFVVIKGVREDAVVLGDPATGTRVLSREDFGKYWTNGILLVVMGRVELARFNRAEDWSIRPRAPMGRGVGQGGLADVLLFRPGPNDF